MKIKYLLFLLMAITLAPAAFADSINVNITSNTWGYHNKLSSSSITVAGYAVADNWNEINQPNNTTVVEGLVDDKGVVTTAFIAFNNDYSWYVTNNINSYDPGTGTVDNGLSELQRNSLRLVNADTGHNTGSTEKELVRIEGIPYSKYTAIVYLATHSSNKKPQITVNSQTYYYTNSNSYALEQAMIDGTDPWLIASNETPNDYSQSANIAVYSGLTEPNFIVTFDSTSGNAGINAIQIVTKDPADHPDPVRGQTMVEVDSELSWSPPVLYTVTGYDIYLSTDEALVAAGDASVRIAQGHPTTSITPGDMTPGVPTYWRVDAIDPNGTVTEGYVLNFETKPATPFIEQGPDSITVEDGTDAILTVSGLNFGSFQWYYSADASNATPGDDTPVGGDSDTLTVIASLATEGWYHCVVTNASGSVASPVARVMTKRLVGLWKLDGDLTDSVATEVSGAPAHDGTTTNTDPSYAAGKVGDAANLLVSQDPNDVIVITGSEDYFDFYPQGLTMSVWVNTNDDGYGAYVAKQDKVGGSKGVLLSHFYDNASFSVRQGPGFDNEVVNIRDGGWHLITGTLDPDTGIAKLYVDGKRSAGDESTWNPANMTLHDEPLFFGAETSGGSVPFDGLIDDVRIYNYALDPVTIAKMYIEHNPGATVCIDDISEEAGDLNGDCEVNLEDFAIIAADWLNCLLVPDCF